MTTMSDNDPKYPLLQNEETGQSAYPPYPPSYGSGGNAANGPTFPQGQFVNQVVHHQPMPMAANQTTVIHSTSVVTTQPAGRIWQAGLCDCCSDCGVCLCVTCCTSCYMCGLSRRMDENCCLGYCYGGLALMRAKFRITHRIEGSLCEDACVSVCCNLCVMCQLGREMNLEGYDKKCCGVC
ncbi:placenta-specific gene 8 protein-like [Clavelina lepadiformis]|uniref:placenta-specific gene 8 protein-like n=1 Tax=Clavelina lepadiformis TaxID=159417 RepID=UPI0040418DDC